jgi:hypothetical protein
MVATVLQAGFRYRDGVKESITGFGNTIVYVLRPSGNENNFNFWRPSGWLLKSTVHHP